MDASEFAENVAQTGSLLIQAAPVASDIGNRRKREFLFLVSHIADRLDAKDIKNIIFHRELPSNLSDKAALDVLDHLYRRGVFTESDARPLAQLLKDINREDLTGRVDTFIEHFGESCHLAVDCIY